MIRTSVIKGLKSHQSFIWRRILQVLQLSLWKTEKERSKIFYNKTFSIFFDVNLVLIMCLIQLIFQEGRSSKFFDTVFCLLMRFFSFHIIEFSQFLVKIVSYEKFWNILVSKRFKEEITLKKFRSLICPITLVILDFILPLTFFHSLCCKSFLEH